MKGCGITSGLFVLIIVAAIGGLFLLLKGEEQKPPQITTGGFPFVCEFGGYDSSALTFNKPRTWNAKLKSGDEGKTIISQEENTYSALGAERLNERTRVVLNYGSAAYYMGDEVNSKNMIYEKPFFYYSERYKADEKTIHNTGNELSEKDLEKYF